MSTLYWLTVLGNIYTLSKIILIILLIVTLFISLEGLIDETNEYACEDDKINAKKYYKVAKKLALYSILPILIIIFTPSRNQLYAIYGVGTVLDYAKSSKEVQKLPDNAVKALNIYLENIQKKDSMIKQEK